MAHPEAAAVLTSLRNPQVRAVVQLRNRRHRQAQRRFVIEGRRELACAADAGWALRTLYHCPELAAGGEAALLRRCEAAGADCVATSRAVFERMSYRRTPDGLLAVADAPERNLAKLPADIALCGIGCGRGELWLVAAAIGVPGNLGAMLRSADAAGASGVLVADAAVDVFNPNVVRASMGALFSTPLAVAGAEAVREWLAGRGVRVVLADPAGASDYTTADFTGDLAIVVGSESAGLDDGWRRYPAVRVPMAGRVDSLNAATAAAVLLFEARRQRLAGCAT